jgi:hypothetical protein
MRLCRRHTSGARPTARGIPISLRRQSRPRRPWPAATPPGSICQKAEATAHQFDGADGPGLPLQLRPRPILPELLSAFDKHIQVLVDRSPRDNVPHHTRQRWITIRRAVG